MHLTIEDFKIEIIQSQEFQELSSEDQLEFLDSWRFEILYYICTNADKFQ